MKANDVIRAVRLLNECNGSTGFEAALIQNHPKILRAASEAAAKLTKSFADHIASSTSSTPEEVKAFLNSEFGCEFAKALASFGVTDANAIPYSLDSEIKAQFEEWKTSKDLAVEPEHGPVDESKL